MVGFELMSSRCRECGVTMWMDSEGQEETRVEAVEGRLRSIYKRNLDAFTEIGGENVL